MARWVASKSRRAVSTAAGTAVGFLRGILVHAPHCPAESQRHHEGEPENDEVSENDQEHGCGNYVCGVHSQRFRFLAHTRWAASLQPSKSLTLAPESVGPRAP